MPPLWPPYGALPRGQRTSSHDSLPSLFIPNVPLNLETLSIIAPFALDMALVGLMESPVSAKLVDAVTHSSQNPRGLGPGHRQHHHRLPSREMVAPPPRRTAGWTRPMPSAISRSRKAALARPGHREERHYDRERATDRPSET